MMKKLLESDFVSYYKLSKKPHLNIVSTHDEKFDLKDDEILLYKEGDGVARYHNPGRKQVHIINYELYFKSLPQHFQQNKKNCDLLVYTDDKQCFLLNELTDTRKKKGKKERKAEEQMLEVLKIIKGVPSISEFIEQHPIRRCCFFNKKAQAPKHITAVDKFNRISNYSPNGFKMNNSDIKKLGFEFWEFSGTQSYLLEDVSTSEKIAEQLTRLSVKDLKELKEIIESQKK